ncbi:MAG TPA: DUF1707 domain-containing protein [Pseudonocardiaceae bacterium]|nr:DUF1707 domain-containing protein [Pseudonocardiaceae bacterium]
MRIGDTERESALAALSEHMSAGRLDIDEYGERTAKVASSKTRGELLDLFTDLPEPHPQFGAPLSSTPPPQAPPPPPRQQSGQPVPYQRGIPVAQRVMSAIVPLAFLGAAALYITTVHFWMIFLVPIALAILGGAIFGDDWKHQKRMRRDYYRQQRREYRHGRRDGW